MSEFAYLTITFTYFAVLIILIKRLLLPNFKIYKIAIVFLILTWILSINVNPYSLENDNKFKILSYINPLYLPKNMGILTQDYSFSEPIVIKPTVCTKCSKQVEIIKTKEELDICLKNNLNTKEKMMYQSFIPYKNEVGILYERNILNNKGKVISIVKRTAENYEIANQCGKNGNTCIEYANLITPELSKIICSIADSIPNFNVGRFDVKYKDDNSLMRGTDFYILEANGTMGFDLRKATTNLILKTYYIIRWTIKRQLIGLFNILSFNTYDIFTMIRVLFITLYNFFKCDDWEKLFTLYS
jgi:hypothetical protein